MVVKVSDLLLHQLTLKRINVQKYLSHACLFKMFCRKYYKFHFKIQLRKVIYVFLFLLSIIDSLLSVTLLFNAFIYYT